MTDVVVEECPTRQWVPTRLGLSPGIVATPTPRPSNPTSQGHHALHFIFSTNKKWREKNFPQMKFFRDVIPSRDIRI